MAFEQPDRPGRTTDDDARVPGGPPAGPPRSTAPDPEATAPPPRADHAGAPPSPVTGPGRAAPDRQPQQGAGDASAAAVGEDGAGARPGGRERADAVAEEPARGPSRRDGRAGEHAEAPAHAAASGTGGAQSPPDEPARALAAGLEAARVRVVALTWTDNAGIVRAKAVPVARLESAARFGVGMSPCFDVYTSADLMTASEHLGGPDGDLRLFPDLGRLVPLAAQPGWAWAPVDRYDQTGRPHPGCQRRFARAMQERAAAHGIGLRMGFETEWVVATPGLEPPSTGPAYGMTRIVELSDYLRDIAEALAAQHVEVLQIHPEYTVGQFEVSTAPAAGPVGAADDVVLVRETVRAVTARHGWRASFAPRFTAGTVGNGSHLHFSLDGMHRDPRGRYGLAPEAESFLAGVLDRLPALTAVANPSPASSLRLVPSHWAGAYRCWGVENREAALRLVPGDPADPDGGHAEYKCADAAANPYLLAGSVIAAGLAGVAEGARLPEPVAGDPAGRPGAERLPAGLGEAADHFARADFLKEAMGEVLHGAFLAVRRAENAAAEGRTAEEITDDTRWRY